MYDVCCPGTRVFNETCVVYTQSRLLLVVSSYRNFNVLSEEERRHLWKSEKILFSITPEKWNIAFQQAQKDAFTCHLAVFGLIDQAPERLAKI